MFSKIWLRGCTRCKGDLSQERDEYGDYIACLQCGARVWEPDSLALAPQAVSTTQKYREVGVRR